MHAVGMTGKARARDQAKEGGRGLDPGLMGEVQRTPLLVRLARGEVAEATSKDLSGMLRLLHCDTELKDKGRAIEQLLLTGAELIIRFSMYMEYPFRLALCCQAHNQTGYLHSITQFLTCNRDSLDVGYSIPLQAAALGQGSIAKALAWMSSQAVQQELMTWSSSVEGSTLDVERAHNQAKR